MIFKFKKKISKFSFLSLFSSLSFILVSCSTEFKTNAYQITSANQKYNQLSTANISLKNAIYGSNFNNGNFIFFYGWTGNDSNENSKNVANFLYGSNSIIKPNMKSSLSFEKSDFFSKFFNTNGLGSKNNNLGYSVSFLTFVDFAPYNDKVTINSSIKSAESPTARFNKEEILREKNNGDIGLTTINNLSLSDLSKINIYKRADDSANQFRSIIKYINEIRPGSNHLKPDYGLIAFKKGKRPKDFSITSQNIYNELVNYYISN